MADTNVAGFIDDLNNLPNLVSSISQTKVWAKDSIEKNQFIYFVGMGSSYYAAQDVARQLRNNGYLAVAEIASALEIAWKSSSFWKTFQQMFIQLV